MGRTLLLTFLLVCIPTAAAADPATKTVSPTRAKPPAKDSSGSDASESKPDEPGPDEVQPNESTPDEPQPTESGASTNLSLSASEEGKGDDDGDDVNTSGAAAANKGFYLRSSLGGGFAWAQADETEDQPDLAVQTLGPALMLSPGYHFAPELSVHADLYGALAFAVKLTPEDESAGYERKKIGFIASTLGVGLTYHALPQDLYASAGFGLSGAWGSQWSRTFEVLTEPALTGLGYAAHGSVGKLFVVHPRWSVGGSLNYNLQTFGRRNAEILSIQRVHALWLGFSTTFHPKR
jgi:hypothetical protein